MASLNKVELIGRLGQDPKVSYLPSGQPVAELSVATDESYKDREGNKVEKTEWHRVKVFGRAAEFCGNWLSKGRLVFVCGKLTTRSWDKDGQTHYMTEVVVSGPQHSIQGLDRAPEGQGQGQNQGQGSRQGGQQQGRGNQNSGGRPQQSGNRQSYPEDDLGPAFPSEASGMDDVPFAMMLAPLAALALAALHSGLVA